MKKMWRYLLYLVFIILGFLIYSLFNHFVKYREYEASELVAFSQLRICSMDEKPLGSTNKPDGSFVFTVTSNIEKIYVCGSVRTARQFYLTIYLYKGDDEKAFYAKTSPEPLQSDSFIIELISKDQLDPREYRTDLYNGRYKLDSVRFIIEK